jgi:undecaprenyl-diphosphatase
MWYDIDRHVLLSINGAHHYLFDYVMILISSRWFWIWLYILITGMAFRQLGTRVVFFVLFTVMAVAIADLSSVHLFKNLFLRLRPCHNEELIPFLRLPAGCGGMYGFISSHAANTAAISSFVAMSGVFCYNLQLQRVFLLNILLILYPLSNAYSRIYLGKHFPSDVIAGMLWGIIIGIILAFAWRHTIEKPERGRICSPRQKLKRKP